MDCHQGSGFADGNVVGFQYGNSENNVNENYGLGSADTNLKSNHDGRLLQLEVGSEQPNKRAKSSPSMDLMTDKSSKAIANIFYKTKPCWWLLKGACCPYTPDCNFAHSEEELRIPPPNWQEIVDAQKKEQVQISEQREAFQMQILGFGDGAQGSTMRQHCKKFLTKKGCSYGGYCTYRHDDHYKSRESEAICLVSGTGDVSGSNRKTKLCDNWELTGNCPFGSNCSFAHGLAELRTYNQMPRNTQPNGYYTHDTKQMPEPAKAIGVSSKRLPNMADEIEPTRKWKGPDKISKIYGDWIDDLV